MAVQKSQGWSREVTEHSNALDLEKEVFNKDNPRAIAQSLKHSGPVSLNGRFA